MSSYIYTMGSYIYSYIWGVKTNLLYVFRWRQRPRWVDLDMTRSDWSVASGNGESNWFIKWGVLIGLPHSYPRSDWLAS